MIHVRGVYEVALPVRELERAEKFYREVLGLEVGLRDERRRWLFLRAGGNAGMVVLQENPAGWARQHFALTVAADEIDGAAARLKELGIEVVGPVLHEWMGARSVYFADPDGHDLELCAPLAATEE
jgi:catechol 2,3-dioxygenase-like lactoylglutathione lyase family enzyme